MRIGLFISGCEGTLQETLNLGSLRDTFSSEVDTYLVPSFFDAEEIAGIVKSVREKSLEAVVLAGNSSRQNLSNRQGDLLISMLEQAGINPNRIASVNLKEHVAKVHSKGQAAQDKAVTLIRVALAKVEMSEDIEVVSIIPRKTVAIIGANKEAWLAAERLLTQNFRVYLLGMEQADGKPQAEQSLPPELLAVKTFTRLHPKATLMENCLVTDLYGWPGDFVLKVSQGVKSQLLEVGAILVADNNNPDLVAKIRPILHLETGDQGLFVSKGSITKSVNSVEEGIFIIPPENDDKLVNRVSLADSATLAIITYLEQPEILHNNVISEVNKDKCGGCGTCVKTCSFRASSIDLVNRVSIIDPKRCKGCGNCVTACPTGARDLLTYPQSYLLEAVRIMGQHSSQKEGKVLALLCEGCGMKALDHVGIRGEQYSEEIMPLGVRCGGNIDTQLILEAFVHGFDGVVICKCDEDHCLNIVGNADLDRRANLFREVLRSRGIEDDNLRVVETTPGDSGECVHAAQELYDVICNGRGEANER